MHISLDYTLNVLRFAIPTLFSSLVAPSIRGRYVILMIRDAYDKVSRNRHLEFKLFLSQRFTVYSNCRREFLSIPGKIEECGNVFQIESFCRNFLGGEY